MSIWSAFKDSYSRALAEQQKKDAPHKSSLTLREELDKNRRTTDILIMMNVFSTNIDGIRDIHPSVQGSASETELRRALVRNMLHEVNRLATRFPELSQHPYTAVVEIRAGKVVGLYTSNTILQLNMGSPREFLEKLGKPDESYLFVDMSKQTSTVDLPFFELPQVPSRPTKDDIAGQPADYRRRMRKKSRPEPPVPEKQPLIVRRVLGAYQEMPLDVAIGEPETLPPISWDKPESAYWVGPRDLRDNLDIYLPRSVDLAIREHLTRLGSRHETAGALIGYTCHTPDGRRSVRVVDYCPFPQEALITAPASVTITPRGWTHVSNYITQKRSRLPLMVVGWAHSHPGFGLFLSGYDDFINKHFFPGYDQIGIVFDPSDEGFDSSFAPFSRHGTAEPLDYARDSVTFGDGMRFHKGYYLYDLEEEERVQRSIDQIVVSDDAPADQPEVTVLGPTQQVGRPESRARLPQPETAMQYTAEQFYHRLRERYPFSPGTLRLVTPDLIPNYPSWDYKDPKREWGSSDLVLLAENWGVPFALRANGVHFRLLLTAPYKKSDGSWAVREYEPTSNYPSEREYVLPNWPDDWRSMTQAQLRVLFKNRHQTELSSSTARAMLQGNYDLRLSLAGFNQLGQAQYLKEAQSRMQFDSSNCGPACLYSAMLRSLSIDRPFTSGFRTMGQFEAEDLLGVTLPQPPWVKRTERPEIVITPSPEPPAVAASVGKFPPRRRGMAVNQAVAAQDNREAPQPISQRPEKLVLTTIDGQVVDTAGFYRAVLVMIRKREGEEVSMTEQLQALGKLTAASRQALGRWLEQQET